MTCQTCPCFLVHVQYSNLCFLVLVSCHWIWAHVSQFSFPSLCYTVFVRLSLFLGLCFSILVRRSGFFLQSLFPGPCFVFFFLLCPHFCYIFLVFFFFSNFSLAINCAHSVSIVGNLSVFCCCHSLTLCGFFCTYCSSSSEV